MARLCRVVGAQTVSCKDLRLGGTPVFEWGSVAVVNLAALFRVASVVRLSMPVP